MMRIEILILVSFACVFTIYSNTLASGFEKKVYNNIILSIQDSVNVYYPSVETPVGTIDYIGHQLYDIDDDGIKELFVFRQFGYGKKFIDAAYTISEGKAVEFNLPKFDIGYSPSIDYENLKTIYKNGGTRDEVFYALTDGRIARFSYHWSGNDGTVIYDIKNKSVTCYECDITSYNRWSKNGMKILDSKANLELDEILNKVGMFPTEVQNKSSILNDDLNK